MHRPEAQAIAREAVPGSGEPRVTPLASGLLNDTYRVDRDGRSFSLRIAAMSQGSTPDRAWELKVLQDAAQRGLAPPLVCGNAERGFLVQEWVGGQPWPASSVRESANIARLAELLKRVHQLPQPTPQRVMRPSAWVEHYAAALAAANGGIATTLAGAAEARITSLEALPRPPSVVCHSDLHLLNLLECPPRAGGSGGLMLLDWEYAHVSEAFWDLAGWSANNDFSDRLLRLLLSAYLGREPQPTEWTRCQLLVWLYDYVCLLWSQLYISSRRGSAAAGISARAEVLNERLNARITHDI
jgi:thiamine kinase-like enzyme